MKVRVFAVRIASSREAVGIIAARTPADIAYILDEFCPTQGMEYREIGEGGIFIAKTVATWPSPPYDVESDVTSLPFDGISENWAWRGVEQEDGWKPMPYL